MTNNQILSLLLMLLGIMVVGLIVLIIIFIVIKMKTKKNNKSDTQEIVSNSSKIQQMYSVKSIFNFMEFDRIEDNMIVQKNGKKYLMVVKCQGVNYDLMSGVEKSSVEQGFIQFLNTLRNPIQIYVQTRTVDLTGSINTYKQRVRELGDNLAQKEFEYNQKVRSGNFEPNQLDGEKFEVVKSRNLYEYGTDIVNSTERMSLNKNILTKQYYIVLSHFPEEASSGVYGEDEISNLAFSELYTRAQSTISLLSVCGINSKILDSNELADLLYSSYNRDEAEVYDLNRAINAGYDSLYTTAPDVLEKRMKEIDKQIEIDAIKKANDAVIEVKQEKEAEKKLAEKEKNYDALVEKMAKIVLENNENILGSEVVQEAKSKISKKSKTKEGVTNEQEKNKRAGRTRKSA